MVAAVAVAALGGACSDGDDLPSGPVLSNADCNALQAQFDATPDTDTAALRRLDDALEAGGCYATDDQRAEMLERDGGFGQTPDGLLP